MGTFLCSKKVLLIPKKCPHSVSKNVPFPQNPLWNTLFDEKRYLFRLPRGTIFDFLRKQDYIWSTFSSIFHCKKRGHFEVPFWISQKGTDWTPNSCTKVLTKLIYKPKFRLYPIARYSFTEAFLQIFLKQNGTRGVFRSLSRNVG